MSTTEPGIHCLPRRRLFFLLIAFIFGWVLWTHFAELELLQKTLSQGQPWWIAAAATMQLLFYLTFSGLYWSAFDTVDVRSNLLKLIPLVFASVFVNSTVTSAGAAGAALFVEDAGQRGQSTARATAGTVLVLAADYMAFAVLLTAGLALLIHQHDLTRLEGFSALLMYVLILVVFGVLSAGLWSPRGLLRTLHAVQRVADTVGHLVRRPNPLGEHWAEHIANEFISAATHMAEHPVRLVRTVVIAALLHVFALLSLYMLFRAFQQPVTVSILIVIYAMTMLFWIISPTPNGIGVVETVMPVIYTSVYIPLESGTVINLAFRGLSFWLPMFVGFLLLRHIRLFRRQHKTEVASVPSSSSTSE